MAFLPGFQHDVFVSYAHADNTQRFAQEPKWVDDLHEVIKQELPKRLGARQFSIWMDHALRGNQQVDPTIRLAVQQSAVLLCVLSPSYLSSAWCREESQLFQEALPAGAAAEALHRVLKVQLLPLREDQQEPAILRAVKGYEFYSLDRRNQARELYRANNEAYWEHALDLVIDAAELLKQMAPLHESAAPAEKRPTVYLAEVAADLHDVRLQLKRKLKQEGIGVLPDTPLPNTAELLPVIRKHLQAAGLAVHLVGAAFGERAFGEEHSLVQAQYRCARELARQRIVWTPDLPARSLSDRRQRDFLELLEDEDGIDLQRGVGLESLVDAIVKKVGGVPPPPPPVTPQLDIACQEADSDEAHAIKNYACHSKFDVNVAVDNDAPQFSRRFQQVLKRSDALLILYGKAAPAWVAERAGQAREAVRKRTRAGRRPLVALVYDGPPAQKGELPFSYQDVPIVTSREQIAQDAVLASIKTRLRI
jgi:hypothetical protein